MPRVLRAAHGNPGIRGRPTVARGKRWRRQGHARGRYAPRLRPVWLVAPLWVVAATAIAVVIYLQLRAVAVPLPGPNGGPVPRDPFDVIKTTITVAGFGGAVLVGVYGFRKQRLVEGDAHRADVEQLAQRYTTAAGQLGHEKPAVRLAGVYAMAQLADDWNEQRQVCIDVLCAYLRMPYEANPANENYREGEREVRYTIIRIIRDHIHREPSTPTVWRGCDFDFTNATFDGGDFELAEFTGKVSFRFAKFIGGEVSFRRAIVRGGEVSFENAEFIGGMVSFQFAQFALGDALFSRAKFIGGEVSFRGANFIDDGMVSFDGVEFTGGEVSFDGAMFPGGLVLFEGAKFTGGKVSFHFAEFTGGDVSFDNAEFISGKVSLDAAKYTGGDVSFDNAEFIGSRIIWGPFKPPAEWTALQEREWRQNEPPP
jgi:uncharacterized protein YjbI with pentapeptide repeats